MIKVEFDDDVLRHYCSKYIPEISQSLNLDMFDCSVKALLDERCPLCDGFDNSIRQAIMREASKRLKE